ncbi:MAG TPA: PilZ domain-containing protein [Anaeromyxobacteraceae bacterium]
MSEKGTPLSVEERRDSARVPIRIMVRDPAMGGSFEEYQGNLSIGGVFFVAGHPPLGGRVELRFLLPGGRTEEIRATGDVIRVTREGQAFGTHVRFVEMPLEAELAVARFLEGR